MANKKGGKNVKGAYKKKSCAEHHGYEADG